MRVRAILAGTGVAAVLIAACTDGSDDVEVGTPDETDEGEADGDAADVAVPGSDLSDRPSSTIETPTLDGRTLMVTAPEDVVPPEPSATNLRFASDTFGMTVTSTDDVPDDGPPGEPELEEERWDGELRILTTPEGAPLATYDDGETTLLAVADDGPMHEVATSTDELIDALDRIEVEGTDDGPLVRATDPDLQRGLSATYELDGIEAELTIADDPEELFVTSGIEPVDEPTAGEGGEVVVGEDGFIELTTDEGLVARTQLILPDEDEQQRGLDLMHLLEVELVE